MSADTVSPTLQTALNRTTKAGSKAGMDYASKLIPDGMDEGTTTLAQTNNSLNHIGGAYVAVTSDNMAAMIEAGALAGRLVTDMTKSYIDAISYAAVTYAGLGRDCLTCRTPADLVEFQKKAIEGFTETCESARKTYSNLFEGFSTAFEPLMRRSANGPERLFRAFAD